MSPELDDGAYRGQFYRAVSLKQQDVVRTMRRCIDFTVGRSQQILSGFRGSGRASELFRLRGEVEQASGRGRRPAPGEPGPARGGTGT